jgi:hypothetical protein
VFGEAQNRLRALLPVALERLEREITSEASEVGWKAALELLKLGHLTPGEAGMTDAEAIIESHAFGRRGGDPVDALLAQVNGAKPSDQEKKEALRELLEKASAQGREVDA